MANNLIKVGGLFVNLIISESQENLKTVVEEVLKCHFEENEFLMVLKSL